MLKQRHVAEISKFDPLLSLSLGAKSSSEKQEKGRPVFFNVAFQRQLATDKLVTFIIYQVISNPKKEVAQCPQKTRI